MNWYRKNPKLFSMSSCPAPILIHHTWRNIFSSSRTGLIYLPPVCWLLMVCLQGRYLAVWVNSPVWKDLICHVTIWLVRREYRFCENIFSSFYHLSWLSTLSSLQLLCRQPKFSHSSSHRNRSLHLALLSFFLSFSLALSALCNEIVTEVKR